MWKINIIFTLLFAIASSTNTAIACNNTEKFNTCNATQTNHKLAISKSNMYEMAALWLTVPCVPRLLAPYLIGRLKEAKARKREKVMRLLLDDEFIKADEARKSKVCTMLFGIRGKKYKLICQKADDMLDIIWDVTRQTIEREIFPIPENQAITKIIVNKRKNGKKGKKIVTLCDISGEEHHFELSLKKQGLFA